MLSRTKNSIRNIIVGLMYKGLSILIPFFTKTLIIWYLGAEYYGLSSLFTSILSILNLAELGFSSAVVFSMYKLIAESNKYGICALLNYYRTVYKVIGFTILGTGICILPFLKYFINGSYPSSINIYVLFLIYLFDTVISYLLFGYKSALIIAFQRADLVSFSLILTTFLRGIFQVFVLIITKNFYCYIILLPLFTVINNLTTAWICNKYFPQYNAFGKISLDMQKDLGRQIKGLFLNKIGNAVRNSSDNIIISALFGLFILAKYSNYYYIFTSIYGVFLIMQNSIVASIGNSIHVESIEKNYKDFIKFGFLESWLITFFTTCLFCLYQPFIEIWLGKSFLLTTFEMTLFCIYFYVINLNNIINLYFDANGLWWKARYLYLNSTIMNIIMNLILGKLLGIAGIIISTILSLIIFMICGRIRLLFRFYFKSYKQSDYYYQQLYYAFITLICSSLSSFLVSKLRYFGAKRLLCIIIMCAVIPNVVMFVFYFRTKYYEDAKQFIMYNLLHIAKRAK